MFNEAPFTDRSKELMIDIARQYQTTITNWNGKYYNSGVMVISRRHKRLFKKPDREIFSFYEQSYLNMRIAQLGIDMCDIHYRLNRMTCMDKITGEERFASYIIHYAGYPSLDFILNLIPKDLEKWKDAKGHYTYQRHIYISVQGGLGDQVNAEPAIRYMAENVYPGADIRIGTHFPRLFQHLPVKVFEHGKLEQEPDVPYCLMNSLPGPETIMWRTISNLLCHTVDYCSMALLRRILPFGDKRVKLEVSPEDLRGLPKADILIHPGRHWESKTFPTSWWQEIVDGLSERFKIGIIGENDETRGTVDVSCPSGAIDLRDLLDLGELIALIANTRVLVSNDSAPIHIAGAFDNHIVLIPSCKHPEHVLPCRNGTSRDKNHALYKRLTLNDSMSQPTHIYGTLADKIMGNWNDYLPEPDEVIDKALEIYEQ
jgi:hypothetical protein